MQFGQAPLYTDGEMVVAQMDAILRHLARKHNLYGKTEVEHTVIDMMLSGAEDIREKYLLACYQHQFDAESVSGFRNKHLMHGAHINEKNGGAHLYYLEQLVGRDEQFSETGFAVGGCASIADAQLYDLVDIILIRDVMKCKDLQKDYPNLMKVYKTFSALSGVQKYLQSDRRHTKVNGNGLG